MLELELEFVEVLELPVPELEPPTLLEPPWLALLVAELPGLSVLGVFVKELLVELPLVVSRVVVALEPLLVL